MINTNSIGYIHNNFRNFVSTLCNLEIKFVYIFNNIYVKNECVQIQAIFYQFMCFTYRDFHFTSRRNNYQFKSCEFKYTDTIIQFY